MQSSHRFIAGLALAVAAGPAALAQSNVSPVNKFSWQENCGWMNWYDANGGDQGVVVGGSYLSGYIWCENIGWVSVGDGSPANGTAYANATGADHGVNVVAGDELGGLAWGENVGWINFGPFPTLPANQHARIDFGAKRFRGYAWGENIGWINLDDANAFVGIGGACYPDCDQSGTLNVDDFICFQTYFAIGDIYADCDGTGLLNIDDFICFQTYFAIGC